MSTTPVSLIPDDEFNRQLAANVHPPEWENPTPDGRYNLVVIGAGTAGLVTAAVAAGIGAKVALVEWHLMGGDCLNVGCVPSKGLIRAARVWASAQDGAEFGLGFPAGVERDFGAVMARMRRLRAAISHVDSAARFKSLGVDVFIGEARFSGPATVRVGDATLHFARAAICTGARATALPIPGLAEAGFLTNETVFSLTELPRRLAVIGAGPIGCELAQAFARFGSEVTVFELTQHILSREDPDAAAVVQARMTHDGVRFAFDTTVDGVEAISSNEPDGGGKRIRYKTAGEAHEATVDEILVGVGRAPNVEGLGLDEAGVSFDRRGGEGRRAASHKQPAHLRGGRHLLPVQVHACRRRDGAGRDPERAVPASVRPRDGVHRVAEHPLVHLHRAGDCARRDVRSGRTQAGHRGRDLHAAARRRRPRRARRRGCRLCPGSTSGREPTRSSARRSSPPTPAI